MEGTYYNKVGCSGIGSYPNIFKKEVLHRREGEWRGGMLNSVSEEVGEPS